MSGSKEDYQNQANDFQAFQQAQALRHQNELHAMQEEQRRNNEERAKQRQREVEQMEALDQSFAEREKNVLEMAKKTREANQARADQIRREHDERMKDAIKEGSDQLDRQRNFNQSELKNRTTDHMNLLNKRQKEIADTEKNTEEKVVHLKEKKEQIQNQMNEDRKVYHDKKIETSERHALELDKRHEETSAIMLKREENELEHRQRMIRCEESFVQGMKAVAIGKNLDATENHFIDAVNNTRRNGKELSSAIIGLGKYAYTLRAGKSPQPKNINAIKAILNQTVSAKMMNLEACAISILGEQESNNPQVSECHRIAREINEAHTVLSDSVNVFRGTLDENPITDSVDRYKEVIAANTALQKLVISLPSVTKSDYAIGVIMQSTQSLTIGNGHIQASQLTSATVLKIDN